MRISLLIRFSILVCMILVIFSCKKKTEEFKTESLSDYIPLAIGKYITYHVDSTVFTNFGRNVEIHSYQIKHVINALLTDNLGRPAYRVYTYLRDAAGTQSWQPNGSYIITPLSDRVEVIENNLRIIKLHLPIELGYEWKGNTYLASDPYSPFYNFNNDDNMADWDFVIDSTNESLSLNGNTIPDVLNVSEVNEPNLVDTILVSSNTLLIPDKISQVWATGASSNTITIIPPTPSTVENNLTVCNRSNNPAQLNNIFIPAGKNRTYQYRDGNWTYPKNSDNTIDTTLGANAVYSSINFSDEKYAKNIGLVYRQLIMWEFQPTYIADDGYKNGFGIKMWVIDHN